MFKTRKKVFETNSSSSHSMTIASGGKLDDKIYVSDGTCRIYPGEFGWGVDHFTDAATKASYCYTYIQYADEEYRNDLIDMLRKVIMKHSDCTKVVFGTSEDDYYPEGYIDHQSTDVCKEAFLSEETLEKFIFNSKSELVIDNDNH